MIPVLEITKAAITARSKEVVKASSVLLEHFNLNNFYYYKITDSGDFFLFDDNRDVVDYLEVQQFIFKHPHYCHPKYHQTSCQIEKTVENHLLAEMDSTKKYFLRSDFNLALSIVNKTENAVEEFGFHSAQSNEQQISFLFNHMPELHLFMKWFLKNNASTISFLSDNAVHLPDLIGDVFYDNRIEKTKNSYQAKQEFLKMLGVSDGQDLSQRDWDLIKLITQGYSASKIASQLFRSKRTIEHRIEGLKSKLDCSSKVELIQKARELECYGYHI